MRKTVLALGALALNISGPVNAACLQGQVANRDLNAGDCVQGHRDDIHSGQAVYTNSMPGTLITAAGDNQISDGGGTYEALIGAYGGRGGDTNVTLLGQQMLSGTAAVAGIEAHNTMRGSAAIVTIGAAGTATGVNIDMPSTSAQGNGTRGLRARGLSTANNAQVELMPQSSVNIHLSGSFSGQVAYADYPAGLWVSSGIIRGSGAVQAQADQGIGITAAGGGEINLTGSVQATGGVSGIFVDQGSVVKIDSSAQPSPGSIKLAPVSIGPAPYQPSLAGIDHRGKTLTLNYVEVDASSNSVSPSVYGVNFYTQANAITDPFAMGSATLSHVTVMLDNTVGGAEGFVSIGMSHSLGDVTASNFSITTQGSHAPGMDLDSGGDVIADGGSTGTITFQGTANTIETHGDNSYGIGMNQSHGTVTLSNTSVLTHGDTSPGVRIQAGTFHAAAGVTISTAGAKSYGIYYIAPAATMTFGPATSIATAGAGAHGFFADGVDATISAAATPNGVSGLSLAEISVSGQDAAAVAARGATLSLDGGDFDASRIGASAWGALAESAGTVAFKNGAQTSGARIRAGNDGTLDFNDVSAGAAGSQATIDAGGTLDLTTRSGNLGLGSLSDTGTGGTVALGANTLTLDGSGNAAFHGTIQGTGGLAQAGSGVQTLAGAGVISYTGNTTVQAGTLTMEDMVDGSGSAFVVNGGTLDVSDNGGTLRIKSLEGTAGMVVTGMAGGPISDLTVLGNNATTFSGAIVGDGALIKQGAATLTLSGPTVFGNSGGTTITQGTVAITGLADAGTEDFRIAQGGVLDISGAAATVDSSSSAQGLRVGSIAGSAGTSGTIELGTKTLDVAGARTTEFAGTIHGAGSLIKEGSGTLTLTGENAFQYSGTSTIKQGVLLPRDVDPSTFSHTFVMDGGWLDLSDGPVGSGVNDWTRLVINDGPNAADGGIIGADDRIDLGQDGADQTEASQIGGDGATPADQGVAVVKRGSNTVTLSGDNHYVGHTRIDAGTLRVTRDANLGEVSLQRAVVLNGGGLGIAASFDSQRQIQLRQSGTVTVEDGVDTTWTDATGLGHTLTKAGNGRLTFRAASQLGAVQANGGMLDLGQATIDATSTTSPAAPAISMGQGATVSLKHGTVNSAGDAIVATGSSTLNLASHTAVNAGAGAAVFRVNGGSATLNANAQSLTGLVAADGASSSLSLNLVNGSTYTGVPVATNGATSTINIVDDDSTWNVTGDAALQGLSNAGLVAFGAPAPTGATARAAAASAPYNTVHVAGNYTGSGGTIAMRTALNAGGALADQHTDRLLIAGNATGHTVLDLRTSGSGANTNALQNGLRMPGEGISLVQVGGSANADAFSLKNGYVVASGSPYQYRLFAYGPGSGVAPDASQSLLPAGSTWDYRLQTACVSSDGSVAASACVPSDPDNPGNPGHPGHPDSPDTPSARPALVPQASSYLVAPLAIENYGATLVNTLHQRLGDIRHHGETAPGDTPETYARVVGNWGNYRTSRDWAGYGYDFDQDIEAMQIGANWLHVRDAQQDFRLGLAGSAGTSSVRPDAPPEEDSKFSFDAYNIALTGTWQNAAGWYVDGVLSTGFYHGKVSTSTNGSVARLHATGLDASVEAGKRITLDNGVELEPGGQLLYQAVHFKNLEDDDGISAKLGTSQAVTARASVRATLPMPSSYSWRPFVKAGVQHTWNRSATVRVADLGFDVGRSGSALILGLGADGDITRKLSLYGEVSGLLRVGGHGYNNAYVNVGMKYRF